MEGNFKKILVVVILLLTGVLAVVGLNAARTYLSGAAAGEEPVGVRIQAEATSAIISWTTEKPVQAVVEYGTSPASLLLRAVETQATTAHRVTLSPLKPDTPYYFRIRVGDNVYENCAAGGNCLPYSFRTKAQGTVGKVAPTPTPSPSPAVMDPSPAATSSSAAAAKCDQKTFKAKFGSKDAAYDYDKNGVVNTRDWILCLKKNQ